MRTFCAFLGVEIADQIWVSDLERKKNGKLTETFFATFKHCDTVFLALQIQRRRKTYDLTEI